jgi:hypothetical protein
MPLIHIKRDAGGDVVFEAAPPAKARGAGKTTGMKFNVGVAGMAQYRCERKNTLDAGSKPPPRDASNARPEME